MFPLHRFYLLLFPNMHHGRDGRCESAEPILHRHFVLGEHDDANFQMEGHTTYRYTDPKGVDLARTVEYPILDAIPPEYHYPDPDPRPDAAATIVPDDLDDNDNIAAALAQLDIDVPSDDVGPSGSDGAGPSQASTEEGTAGVG